MGLMDFHPADCDCDECADFNEWAAQRLASAKQRQAEKESQPAILTDDDSDFNYEEAHQKAIDELKQENSIIPTANDLERWFAL